jgi:hypothetical protein
VQTHNRAVDSVAQPRCLTHEYHFGFAGYEPVVVDRWPRKLPNAVRTVLQNVEEDLRFELASRISESVVPCPKTPFSSCAVRSIAPQVSEKIIESAR